jgi:seryl-tRNA synthetase
MLQIAFIRENQEKVIQVGKRNMDAKSIVEDVIKLDTERRATQVELDILAESNKLSKDIGEMMKNGENRKPLS